MNVLRCSLKEKTGGGGKEGAKMTEMEGKRKEKRREEMAKRKYGGKGRESERERGGEVEKRGGE